ncbi:unknown [Choristoneura occidentalis cypovirus 16]|uniref:VP3 n=1 Tax=Choristoneura fumiferana cypovirus TaxID=59730 RepID=B1PR25_CPVCS|nr:unknown [Choristoneura occidentalis cypovirus 16]ACA53382.1 unknown [Choristoneura occidentalis cypovirus 16]
MDKTFFDERANLDPHPTEVSNIHNNITTRSYYHSYDQITQKHTFRFNGILRYLEPIYVEYTDELFRALDSPNEIEDDELLLLVRRYINRLAFPVTGKNVTSSTRYNFLLANAVRGGRIPQKLIHIILSNPELLNYEKGENPFKLMIEVYGTRLIGNFKYFAIRNVGSTIMNPIGRYGYNIYFINAYAPNEIMSCLTQLNGKGIYSTHGTWSWNAPHIFAYDSISDLHRHLASRILETWREYRQAVLNRIVSLSRPTQVLIPLCVDDTILKLLAYSELYDFRRQGILERSSNLVKDMLLYAELAITSGHTIRRSNGLPRIHVPGILNRWILGDGYFMYPLITFDNGIDPTLRSDEVMNFTIGEVHKHLDPFGEDVELYTPDIGLADSHNVTASYVPDLHDIEDDTLQVVEYRPDDVVTPADILTQDTAITPFVVAGPTEFMTNVKDMQSFTTSTRRAINNMIRKFMNNEYINIPRSTIAVLQIIIKERFSVSQRYGENQTITYTPLIPMDTVHPRQINGSTFKMMSIFLHAIELFERRVENANAGSIKPSVLFIGAENEPAIDIIRLYYADRVSTVSGIGAQAVSHLRAHIGDTPTLALNGDIIISDINFSFTSMEEYQTIHANIFRSLMHAPILVMKVQPMSSSIFNHLNLLRNNHIVTVLLPNGRKTLSTEAYLMAMQIEDDNPDNAIGFTSSHPLNHFTTTARQHGDGYSNNLIRSDRLDILTTNELENMQAYYQDVRSSITTLRAPKAHYTVVRDTIAQLSNHMTMFSPKFNSEFFIAVFTHNYTRLALTARRETTLGDTERMPVSGEGFGRLNIARNFSLHSNISMFVMAKYIIYCAIENDLNELMDSPQYDITDIQDIGCGNLTGLAMLHNARQCRYHGYDTRVLNDNNFENNRITFRTGPYSFLDPFMDHAAIFIIFVIHNSIGGNTLEDLHQIVLTVKDRVGSVVYVTVFNQKLREFLRVNTQISGVAYMPPTSEEDGLGYIVWHNYEKSPIIDIPALIEEYDTEGLEIVELHPGGREWFDAVYRHKVLPLPYRSAALFGLLDGVSILRIES